MKIRSLYYTHKPGGFCKRLYRLLNRLEADGHEVCFYCLDKPPDSLNPKVKWVRIPFLLRARSGFLFWTIFSLWAPIFCFLRTLIGDGGRWVLFSPFYACLVFPTKFVFNSPIICFVRSKLAPVSDSSLEARVERCSQKLALQVADKIVVQTQSNKEIAINLGARAEKLHILPNSVDIIRHKRFEHIQLPLRILTTGVFTRLKNLDFLLAVWRNLAQELPAENLPQLKIVGLPREKIQERKFPLGVTFAPWVTDLNEEYQSNDVYLHPSLHEGMPNSVLEALGHGLIALVANISELKELMSHDELCFSIDDHSDLTRKLILLQKDPLYFQKISELSRERAAQLHFDWDGTASSLAVN